jgi:uncharacterized protein (TIGR00255 family)
MNSIISGTLTRILMHFIVRGNMVYSMTAFGRSQKKGNWGVATWEVRSVNHRYLEVSIRLPEALREIEQNIREIVNQYVERGKVECTLRFQPGAGLGTNFSLNENLLSQLIRSSQAAVSRLPDPLVRINVVDLLAWPNVLIEGHLDLTDVKGELLALFKEAMSELKEGRGREGKVLAKMISDRLKSLQREVKKVGTILPSVIDRQREKIIQRLAEVRTTLDPERLEQEMVYYVQRVDMSEEIDRILSHIAEVERSLQDLKPTGRRLDFMMQELNREANTLASKSMDQEITYAAVEMKVLIEQMREQVQNIE